MAYATLVGLKLTSAGGLIERDVVVQECITMFNLHKVFQLSLNSRQSDDSIAAKVGIGDILRQHSCVSRLHNKPCICLYSILL